MALTYQAIATVTVGSGGAAFIEFTNITQTYTDLVVLVCGRSSRTADTQDNLSITFNGSTSGYSNIRLSGNGSAVSTGGNIVTNKIFTGAYLPSATTTSNTFGNTSIYIPNYAGSANKSVSIDSVTENNSATGVLTTLSAALWSNTAAITTIRLDPDDGDFTQHSTATLYGIKNTV